MEKLIEEMGDKCVAIGENHPEIATTYGNIGYIYDK